MQTPLRKIVPGLLIAFGATAIHASPKAVSAPAAPATAKAAAPVAAPAPVAKPAAPLDLSLPPPAAAPVVAVDPLLNAPLPVKEVVNWINTSGDNTRLPFLVIDKPNARVFAFDPSGQYQGDAPVLLGMGKGDVMLAPSAAMSQMPPHTRITPAGRFVSKLAKDAKGKELLVLDYKAAFSLHPVVPGKPHEKRAHRLGSPTPDDNRISFGCINVPIPFYNTVISPAFKTTHGLVYILPETSQASAYFKYTPPGASPVGALAVSGPKPAAAAAPVASGPASPAIPEAAAK